MARAWPARLATGIRCNAAASTVRPAPPALTRSSSRKSFLAPADLVKKAIDSGEAKVFMTTGDTLIRAFMAGAILALAAASTRRPAISAAIQHGVAAE